MSASNEQSFRRLRHRHQRPGFLLLSVIVFLVIAQLMLVSLARRSLDLAVRAERAEHSLQTRWGTTSCQYSILPNASRLFLKWDKGRDDDRVSSRRREPPRTGLNLQLGKQSFALTLQDEDAKLNLNRTFHLRGPGQVITSVRMQMGTTKPLKIFPRSSQRPQAMRQEVLLDDEFVLPDAYTSWSQVFELRETPRAECYRLPVLTTNLTLFSDGKINIHRAGDQSVIELCRLVMPGGAGQRIVRNYRDRPELGLERVIETAGLSPRQRALAKELLAEQSTCYSLWVTVQSANRPLAQTLFVAQRVDDSVVRTITFAH